MPLLSEADIEDGDDDADDLRGTRLSGGWTQESRLCLVDLVNLTKRSI